MGIIQYHASDGGAEKWEREVEQRVLGALHVLTRPLGHSPPLSWMPGGVWRGGPSMHHTCEKGQGQEKGKLRGRTRVSPRQALQAPTQIYRLESSLFTRYRGVYFHSLYPAVLIHANRSSQDPLHRVLRKI